MTRRAMMMALLAAGFLLLFSTSPVDTSTVVHGRDLTLAERIGAERVIRQVYYEHQRDAGRPFEEVYSDDTLRRIVVTYLKESVALEEIWGAAVTDEDLRGELERIARGTRFPERLREIYGALGNDSALVRECFARPVLVKRLTRKFFYADERLQAEPRLQTENLRRDLDRGRWHGDLDRRARILEFTRAGGTPEASVNHRPDGIELELEPTAFDRLLGQVPERPGELTGIIERRHDFLVRAILERSRDTLRVLDYTVPKRTWEAWWADVEQDLDERAVMGVAAEGMPLPEPAGRPLTRGASDSSEPVGAALSTCAPPEQWDNGSLDDTRTPRTRHTAVWTGSTMIVWGGANNYGAVLEGEAYDPVTDAWKTISTANDPDPRVNHVAVWTGQEMIVWGGLSLNTGGRYNPATDQWTTMSTVNAPAGRSEAKGVWTGSSMVVWGGRTGSTPLNSGGRYNPATDTWTATSTVGAPTARAGHTAVWTGSRMIVWGGGSYTNTGGRYDPVSDAWAPTSTANAPVGRTSHAGVWTGTSMIIWGGAKSTGDQIGSGGRYDPVTDTWSAVSSVGAPPARVLPDAVWTGSEMLIWGGSLSVGPQGLYTGGRYDPASDTWRAMTLANVPDPGYQNSAIWADDVMIVWGGTMDFYDGVYWTGGRYDPVLDRWTPIDAPGPQAGQTAIWTGTVMIIWGGTNYTPTDSGGRYDPLTDDWSETSWRNAPSRRFRHTAVWSGDAMVIWGGFDGTHLQTGGRYDPVTDTWTPTSTIGAPSPRQRHTAVWTGSEMLVWGGSDGGALSTGGRYSPVTDSWTPTSAAGAPTPRHSHSAVWSGAEMVVWGGSDTAGNPLGDGSRYDPAADAWLPTSSIGAPQARAYHSALWTGSRMLVWGGSSGQPINTGAQYDPGSDVWIPITATGAPVSRAGHVAVWTGLEMIVWGGSGLNTGGRYDPVLDRWTATTTIGAPIDLDYPAGVWADGSLIVWGASFGVHNETTDIGGRYFPGTDSSPDSDLDGFSVCRGDCNDSSAVTYPGAPQICDGVNNDCSDPSWPTPPADEADADGDGFRLCQGDCNDASAVTYPGATEICDGLDNNCDGVVDEGAPGSGLQCGTSNVGQCKFGLTECSAGSILCVGAVYPSEEICNGLDDDCDGAVPVSEADADGDGFRGCQNDCNDSDPAINSLAVELPGNTIDENCDGVLACDPGAFYERHAQFVRCVVQECGGLVAAGAVNQAQCEALVSQAARSDTGRRPRQRPRGQPSEP